MPLHNTNNGSCLDTAVVSVSNMDRSLQFYHHDLGLRVIRQDTVCSQEFNSFWRLPNNTETSYALLGAGPDLVGRVLLLQFNSGSGQQIRTANQKSCYGLFNLNFYTQDIRNDHRIFVERGYSFWSSPVQHDFGETVGQPIEVVFEGPDGVAINPVQLESLSPDTMIAEMRLYVDDYGRTATGHTPVVTSAHFVQDIQAAIDFHEQVLEMSMAIDRELSSPESNHFLGLQDDARTRTVFMQGNHMFGKVCLVQPLNYQCESVVPMAEAPNVGFLAQCFLVPDLPRAMDQCDRLKVEVYSTVTELRFPGLGHVQTALVRNPGSGALMLLYSP